MAKYRKKPVVIDAEPYHEGLEDGLIEWCHLPVGVSSNNLVNILKFRGSLSYQAIPYINTLEGRHFISKGDYIITGVRGERYPCKKDIFEETYEKVDE